MHVEIVLVAALHLSVAGDGLYQFDPPGTFPARTAVESGVVAYLRLSGPKKIIVKLNAKSAHASAKPLTRQLVDRGRYGSKSRLFHRRVT